MTYADGRRPARDVDVARRSSTRRPGSRGRSSRPSAATLRLTLTPAAERRRLFVFRTQRRARRRRAAAAAFAEKPYVVPNPYVGAASFEPERFAISGRGERRMEFRAIPQSGSIRIYTVRGDLVQTLRHDGSTTGFVAWDLRTKDNLDVAPGLYIFQVEAPGVGEHDRQVRDHQMRRRASARARARRVAALVAAGSRSPAARPVARPAPRSAQFLLIEPSARIAGDGERRRALDGRARRPLLQPGGASAMRANASSSSSRTAPGSPTSASTTSPAASRSDAGERLRVSVTALNSGDIDVRTVEPAARHGRALHVTDVAIGLGYGARDHRPLRGRHPAHLRRRRRSGTARRSTRRSSSARSTGCRTAGSNRREPLELRHPGAVRRPRPAHPLRQRPGPLRRQRLAAGERFTEAYPVPVLFRVGLGDARAAQRPTTGAAVAVDAFHPSDNTESVSPGAEYAFQRLVSLRAGYQNLFLEDSEVGPHRRARAARRRSTDRQLPLRLRVGGSRALVAPIASRWESISDRDRRDDTRSRNAASDGRTERQSP